MGLPEDLVWRHPFPGPGLAVRCLGEVTKQRLDVLREADAIVVDEIKAAGLYRQTAQAFAVLLPVQSVEPPISQWSISTMPFRLGAATIAVWALAMVVTISEVTRIKKV